MKIGIVVTCCGALEYTKNMVASIRTTYPYELIIIDDFSIDSTKEWLKSLPETVTKIIDPNTDSLGAKWNLGVAKAKSLGCAAALVCNNDILFNPATIDNLVKRLEKAIKENEAVVMVTAHNVRGQIKPEEIFGLKIAEEISESEGPDFSCFLLDIDAWEVVGGISEDYKPCLSYHSKVLMEDGSYKSIGDLVYQRSTEKVMSFDEQTNQFITKSIINWYKNKYKQNEWYRPISKHTKKSKWGFKGATFTPDHLILTKNGWKEIRELTPGDRLLTNELLLSNSEFQLIVGCSLGDGHLKQINKSGDVLFQVGHCKKQSDYLSHKAEILKERIIYTHTREAEEKIIQGHTCIATEFSIIRTKVSMHLKDIYEMLYNNGKKTISREYLNLLNAEGLAYWYLDDGSLNGKKVNSPYMTLVVGKQHSYKELENITSWLKNKFNIIAKIDDRKYKWIIRCCVEESYKFFALIAPFVPECMNYKLPDEFKYQYKYVEDLPTEYYYDTLEKVIKVKIGQPNVSSYCLDIEDTHNFITLSGIAHNCYFEDNDFHTILRAYGFKAIAITSAPYYHFGSITQNSVVGGMCRGPQFEANRARYVEKFGALPDQVNIEEVRQRLGISPLFATT